MTTVTKLNTPSNTRRVVYPISDGKPMAETDKHRRLMMYVIDALNVYYADRPDVYVSGNNFVFYEEGNPKARISPDGYVVFGVPPGPRDSYKSWEEGGLLPDVVFEFTSRKTQREDTDTKLPLYERILRVPEYFLFDPTGDYLRPRLQGFRLIDGRYVRLELVGGRFHSERIGLDLVQAGDDLRLYNPRTEEFLPTPVEQARRAESETRRANAAEDEITRLRAELEILRNTGQPSQDT